MNIVKIKFQNVEVHGLFIYKKLLWEKISIDTAIPCGYACSNHIEPDMEVDVPIVNSDNTKNGH